MDKLASAERLTEWFTDFSKMNPNELDSVSLASLVSTFNAHALSLKKTFNAMEKDATRSNFVYNKVMFLDEKISGHKVAKFLYYLRILPRSLFL